VVFNAALGFYQEHRAERTLAALKNMLAASARVRRDGRSVELDAASQLVPGDIVMLEAGDRIPADGRLLAAHALEVIEAALTGESHAVGKSTAALEQPICRSAIAHQSAVHEHRGDPRPRRIAGHGHRHAPRWASWPA
jgi:P-type Ca2+ transporter type 2C